MHRHVGGYAAHLQHALEGRLTGGIRDRREQTRQSDKSIPLLTSLAPDEFERRKANQRRVMAQSKVKSHESGDLAAKSR